MDCSIGLQNSKRGQHDGWLYFDAVSAQLNEVRSMFEDPIWIEMIDAISFWDSFYAKYYNNMAHKWVFMYVFALVILVILSQR